MSCGSFSLGLPMDIPWSKVYVTENMIDTNICDNRFVPKWEPSIAICKYIPLEEYQTHVDHDIVYFKVAVFVTGYQPKDKETEGRIDWDRLTVTEIDEIKDRLN